MEWSNVYINKNLTNPLRIGPGQKIALPREDTCRNNKSLSLKADAYTRADQEKEFLRF